MHHDFASTPLTTSSIFALQRHISGRSVWCCMCMCIALLAIAGCDSSPTVEGDRAAWSDAQGRPAPSDGPAETTAPAAPVNKPTMILVRDFQVAHPTGTEDNSGRPRLLPGILRGARSDLSQSQLVGKLSQRVVSELEQRGFRAQRSTGSLYPRSGWVVQGTFVEAMRADGSFVTDRWGKQDVELTITIDDLVRGTPEPLTDLSVAGAASGIGAPMMPNPFAAGAKFVVRQAELEGDASALASRIADAIARFAASEHVLPGASR